MIFYGWIIGYTISNLQRINKLENWCVSVKEDFESWLNTRRKSKMGTIPLMLSNKIEFVNKMDL